MQHAQQLLTPKHTIAHVCKVLASLCDLGNGVEQHSRVLRHTSGCRVHSTALPDSKRPYYVFRLPKLSPSMTSARILRWHISAGESVVEPQLAITLIPDQLETLSSSESERHMQVEIHEEGVMAVILQKADPQRSVECGAALALICDHDDVGLVQSASEAGQEAALHATRETAWQAFIAS
eukprot:jgi/Ulvmu1/3059/UM015_0099.1